MSILPDAPVATAAHASAIGCVDMSTRLHARDAMGCCTKRRNGQYCNTFGDKNVRCRINLFYPHGPHVPVQNRDSTAMACFLLLNSTTASEELSTIVPLVSPHCCTICLVKYLGHELRGAFCVKFCFSVNGRDP